MKNSRIVRFYNSHKRNKIRMFIFPFAGGCASSFKNWENHFSPEIELCPLQLPGREDRYNEEPYHCIDDFIRELGEIFPDYLDLPYVFFGHSMGALLCYEFSRFLGACHTSLPLHVFLSGASPPGRNSIKNNFRELNDEDMVKGLKNFNGIPHEITDDTYLLKVFLPVFRMDLLLLESYHYHDDYKFSMPITIFGGKSDTAVPCSDLKKWNKLTNSYCRIATLPGDHFFIFSEKEILLAEIHRELRYLSVLC